jgi:hypothetical protein
MGVLNIHRDDIAKYALGSQVQRAATDLGVNLANSVNNDLVNNRIEAVATETGYDGVNFFGSTHPYNGGTQDNTTTYDAASTAEITATEGIAIFEKAVLVMGNMKNDAGVNINPKLDNFVIICGLAHALKFKQLFSAKMFNIPGTANMSYWSGGNVSVIGSAGIASTIITVANVSPGLSGKPFIEVEYSAPTLEECPYDPLTQCHKLVASRDYKIVQGEYRNICQVTIS